MGILCKLYLLVYNICYAYFQSGHNSDPFSLPAPYPQQVKKAYCPPEIVANNPVIDYAKNIVIGFFGFINITINGVSVVYCMCI